MQVNGKSGASSLLGESADSPHDSSDNPLIYSNGLSSKAINSNGNAIPGNASAMDGGNEARVLGHRIARNHPQNPHLFSPSGSIQIGQNGPYAIPLSERVFGAVPNAVPSISLPMTQLRAEKMPSSFDEPYELSSSIQSRHVGMSAAALRAAADIAPQRSPQYPLARMQGMTSPPAPKPLPRPIPSARDISNLVKWSSGQTARAGGHHQMPSASSHVEGSNQHPRMQASHIFHDPPRDRRNLHDWKVGPAGHRQELLGGGGRTRSDMTDYFC